MVAAAIAGGVVEPRLLLVALAAVGAIALAGCVGVPTCTTRIEEGGAPRVVRVTSQEETLATEHVEGEWRSTVSRGPDGASAQGQAAVERRSAAVTRGETRIEHEGGTVVRKETVCSNDAASPPRPLPEWRAPPIPEFPVPAAQERAEPPANGTEEPNQPPA